MTEPGDAVPLMQLHPACMVHTDFSQDKVLISQVLVLAPLPEVPKVTEGSGMDGTSAPECGSHGVSVGKQPLSY